MTALAPDPVDEFWGQDRPLNGINLTPAERDQAAYLEKQSHEAHDLIAIALVLGGGFLLYRSFAERVMRANLPPKPSRMTIRMLAMMSWRGFKPTWIKLAAPVVAHAYVMGMIDARLGQVPPEVLQVLAMQYAGDIGDYFEQTSAQALVEGFNAHVNRKVPPRLAADRVLSAYGLNPKQMRALVAAENLGAMKVTSVIETNINAKTERYVETQMVARAQVVGDNEAFTAMRRGKQLTWMYFIDHGKIPKTATKVWVTAHDEKVCTYCGPMHGKEALVTEPFETNLGKVWVPALHPNCRCNMELKFDVREMFGKADWWVGEGWDEKEHPRADDGRFVDKPQPQLQAQPPLQPKRTLVATAEEAPPQPQAEVAAPQELDWGGSELAWGGQLQAPAEPIAPLAQPQLAQPELQTPVQPQLVEPQLVQPQLVQPELELPTVAYQPQQLSDVDYQRAVEQAIAEEQRVQEETAVIEQTLAQIRALAGTSTTGTTVPLGTMAYNWERYRGDVFPVVKDRYGMSHQPIKLGQRIRLTDDNNFVAQPNAVEMEAPIAARTEETINDIVNELMSRRAAPTVGPPGGVERETSVETPIRPAGTTPVSEQGVVIPGVGPTTRETLTRAVRAEVYGDNSLEGQELRMLAQHMGVNRDDYATVQIRTNEGFRSVPGIPGARETSPRNWALPGDYEVVDIGEVPETGWPVRNVVLAPFGVTKPEKPIPESEFAGEEKPVEGFDDE